MILLRTTFFFFDDVICFRAFITKLELRWLSVYNDAQFKEILLNELVEKSDKVIGKFEQKAISLKTELKYFKDQYKKPTNLGKPYLLPNNFYYNWKVTHFQLWNYYWNNTKVLHFHLKGPMQDDWSCIADRGTLNRKSPMLRFIPSRSLDWTLFKRFLIKGNLSVSLSLSVEAVQLVQLKRLKLATFRQRTKDLRDLASKRTTVRGIPVSTPYLKYFLFGNPTVKQQ